MAFCEVSGFKLSHTEESEEEEVDKEDSKSKESEHIVIDNCIFIWGKIPKGLNF